MAEHGKRQSERETTACPGVLQVKTEFIFPHLQEKRKAVFSRQRF